MGIKHCLICGLVMYSSDKDDSVCLECSMDRERGQS